MADQPTKVFWQSKTFWISILTMAVGVVEVLSKEGLVGKEGGAALGIVGALNLVLRFMTGSKLVNTKEGDNGGG